MNKASIAAVIFDTDGVITRTAEVHARAWKALFDDYLSTQSRSSGERFVPFDDDDYRHYVDGKLRYAGVASFLASRGITIEYGSPSDGEARESICGLGNRKNRAFLELLDKHGVEAYPSTLNLVRRLRRRGIRTAAVSSSENCGAVLGAVGAADLFDVRVDGVDARELSLASKPDPALFLEASRRLGVPVPNTAVVEDASAGVEAARVANFGLVVFVDRDGHADDRTRHWADITIPDLARFDVEADGTWRELRSVTTPH